MLPILFRIGSADAFAPVQTNDKSELGDKIRMIRLQEVKAEDRKLLWNINQKYLYEMTKYYPDNMDEQGNYHYGYFDAYFTDAERKAFFIYDDEIMVGFVMLNP